MTKPALSTPHGSFARFARGIMSAIIALGLGLALTTPAFAANGSASKLNPIEYAQYTAENQIRNLIEPVLTKYCRGECQLLSTSVSVDVATQEQVAPGFDDMDTYRSSTLAPTSATLKILINQKVGEGSRQNLLELVQSYLDTLDYPVKVDVQLKRFPEPIESASKVADLRQRVIKQFKSSVEELIGQFCPNQCLLADLELKADSVNPEEAQYGSVSEIVQEGGIAIKVNEISASLLMDEAMSPEERTNILEMAKLKTTSFKNVTLSPKVLKFPRPMLLGGGGFAEDGAQGYGLNGKATRTSSSNTNSNNQSNSNSTSTNENKESRSIASSEKLEKSDKSTKSESNSSNSESRNNVNSETKNSVNASENNQRSERVERFEKVERVESGDAVQEAIKKFQLGALIFGVAILALLVFIAMATMKPRESSGGQNSVHKIIQSLAGEAGGTGKGAPGSVSMDGMSSADRAALVSKRYEIERLMEELTSIYAQQPKVAKQVFSRVLTEEGVEVTAQYIHLFGEGIVVDMLRDPSLQTDVAELMEYYAKNSIELNEDEKLDLLRKLHNRTIAGKLVVLGNRSSNLFDFITEMDAMQILEMIRTESLTVKAMVLTQCDQQKRAMIYAQLDEHTRMQLLTELSRIDYLPRDYIYNVANALKRKRRENPRLNTEALPGSEVLISLLERTSPDMQRSVVSHLIQTNPESARLIKNKLVSSDTLRYLRDGQLLEVILSLKHDELLQYMKGAPPEIRAAIVAKSPKELIVELEEELEQIGVLSRETYMAIERKVLNRMKMMANEGIINLAETNDRMFADQASGNTTGFIDASAAQEPASVTNLRRAG